MQREVSPEAAEGSVAEDARTGVPAAGLIADVPARLAGLLTRPLPSSAVVDRERTRSWLILASSLIIAASLLLPHTVPVDWAPALAVTASVALTGAASLSRRCWPILNRFGGLLIAAEITALVAYTGGVASPYAHIFAMLLIYASIFYDTRRLVATVVMVASLASAPHLIADLSGERPYWTELAIALGVWLATCVTVHGLVAELRARTRALQSSEQRYRSLFELNPEGVYSLDHQGRFTEVNEAAGRMLGREPSEMLGRPFEPYVAPGDLAETRRKFAASMAGVSKRYEISVLHREGHHVDVALTTVPIIVGSEVVGVFGVAKDVSKRNALQHELSRLALHDALTGLANRRLWDDRLQQALAQRRGSDRAVALLMLDLDGFKAVNDSLGHAAGDELLVAVADRLRTCVRPGDTLARHGGDEFLLLLPDLRRAEAEDVAERVLEELRRPFPIAGSEVTIAGSVGVAIAETPDAQAGTLMRQADTAMYGAKRAGRDRYSVFESSEGIGSLT